MKKTIVFKDRTAATWVFDETRLAMSSPSSQQTKASGLNASANTIRIVASLDPARFAKLGDIGDDRITVRITTPENITLRAALNPKTLHNAVAAIERHGVYNVQVKLAGRLGPNNTVLDAGISTQPKGPVTGTKHERGEPLEARNRDARPRGIVRRPSARNRRADQNP